MLRTLALVLSLYSNDPNAMNAAQGATVRADAPHEQVEHIFVYGRRLRAEKVDKKARAEATTAQTGCTDDKSAC